MMGSAPSPDEFTITFTRDELASIVDAMQWIDEYWAPTVPPDALRVRLETLLGETKDGA